MDILDSINPHQPFTQCHAGRNTGGAHVVVVVKDFVEVRADLKIEGTVFLPFGQFSPGFQDFSLQESRSPIGIT